MQTVNHAIIEIIFFFGSVGDLASHANFLVLLTNQDEAMFEIFCCALHIFVANIYNQTTVNLGFQGTGVNFSLCPETSQDKIN